MTLGRRPPTRRGKDGLPAWLVFLVGVAVVFGVYYVWLGVRSFLQSGGRGVIEATQNAEIIASATAETIQIGIPTLRPTATTIPPCDSFTVIVPNARVRQEPSETSPVIDSFFENDVICVVGRPTPESEWYTIDLKPGTRRLDVAYMHESVIAPVNPTPTPSRTATSLPTVTPQPSLTPSLTLTPDPTETRIPGITDTPRPTLTPSATPPRQSA